MRIASGIARGISLDSPKGDKTRPATDAARLAIFSSLGEVVIGAKVLDLFAGTGSYGLEALSRGAKSATFVETNPRALAALRSNAKKIANSFSSPPQIDIRNSDCFKSSSMLRDGNFDIIFADPPYSMLEESETLKKILSLFCGIASEKTIIALEAPAQFELPENFETKEASFAFEMTRRLGKKSRGKPSQIIFTAKKNV